eukprot:gene52261-69906_t
MNRPAISSITRRWANSRPRSLSRPTPERLVPGLLPLPVLHGLGWVLGWASFLLSGRYRRRLLDHAAQAGYSKGLALRAAGEAGKLVAGLPRLWLGRPEHVVWDGAAHSEAAQAGGSGVLFLTPHLGCFEITAQAYARRFGARHPMTVLFRPA